jgi:hypothetical protein
MRARSTLPTIELMPNVGINDLRHIIPRDHPHFVESAMPGLRYPHILRLRICARALELTSTNGHVETFPLHWIKTGMGRPRATIVCLHCRRHTAHLYYHSGYHACRRCHGARYLCQRKSQLGRKLLRAAKARIALGGMPSRYDSIAPRQRYKHRRQYAATCEEIKQLEAAAKRARSKGFDLRVFAYHLQS